MDTLHVYTSNLASVKVADLAVGLTHHQGLNVVLRPIEQLPAPLGERLAPLALELEELEGALACTDWCLEQFASGQWQPDAALQNGLVADQEALTSRLRVVRQTLGTLRKGGQDNG